MGTSVKAGAAGGVPIAAAKRSQAEAHPLGVALRGSDVARLRRRLTWTQVGLMGLIGALHAGLTWQAPGVIQPTLSHLFDVDYEMNFPTWFASTQHLMVGLTLLAIGWVTGRAVGARRARWWYLGALAACYLSADEVGVLHERLGGAAEHVLLQFEAGSAPRALLDFPSYYWMLVYLPIAIPALSAAAWFAWRELGPSRRLALLGVFVFLYGAVGMDFIEGRFGTEGNDYLLLLVGSRAINVDIFLIEELAEMSGLAMVLHALLHHLESRLGGR